MNSGSSGLISDILALTLWYFVETFSMYREPSLSGKIVIATVDVVTDGPAICPSYLGIPYVSSFDISFAIS